MNLGQTPSEKVPLKESNLSISLKSGHIRQENQQHPSNGATVDKMAKRQAYLQRFLEWKATKAKKKGNQNNQNSTRRSIYIADNKPETAVLKITKNKNDSEIVSLQANAISLQFSTQRKLLLPLNLNDARNKENLSTQAFKSSNALTDNPEYVLKARQIPSTAEPNKSASRPKNIITEPSQFKKTSQQIKGKDILSAQLSTRMKAKKPVLPKSQTNTVSINKRDLPKATYIAHLSQNFGSASRKVSQTGNKKPDGTVSAAKRQLLPAERKNEINAEANKVHNNLSPKFSTRNNLNNKGKSYLSSQLSTRMKATRTDLTKRKANQICKVSKLNLDSLKPTCDVKRTDLTKRKANQICKVSKLNLDSLKPTCDVKTAKGVSHPVSRGQTNKAMQGDGDGIKVLTETHHRSPSPQKQDTVVDSAVSQTLDSVIYFRIQLDKEIKRLHLLCDEWDRYNTENADRMAETGGKDMIDAAIGQTKLLTSQKLMQFKGLIDRCEACATGAGQAQNDGNENSRPVFVDDLQGWWDMLRLQSDNIDKRFAELTRLKANDWINPDTTALSKPKTKSVLKTKGKPKVKPSSDLKAFLQKAIAEKRKKQATEGIPEENTLANHSPNRHRVIVVRDRKSFSPVRTVLRMPNASNANRHAGGVNNLLRSAILGAAEQFTREQTVSPVVKKPSSILKTPDTKKRESTKCSVTFSAKKKVRRFKLCCDEGNISGDDIIVGGERLEDLEERMSFETSANSTTEKADSSMGTYKLRNRCIKLRPSSEFM